MRDMLGRGKALSVEKASDLILQSLTDISSNETLIGLEESYGRVLSTDIVSPDDVPGFTRSTMDGFAVIASDTFGAGEGNPAYLDVKHDILMGDAPGFRLENGEAARIATGGMLPEGADAVLMLEYAQDLGNGMIEAQKSIAPGDNIIRKGEDVAKGESLLKKGRRLRPQDVAALAAVGLVEVPVYERPVVSILSTGDEIVPPGTQLRPGFVRDTNSFSLAGLVLSEGCVPRRLGIFRDDYGLIREAVEDAAASSSAVLISGGSSVGTRDMTERVISGLGRVLFHSVAMKPGKPLLAGIVQGVPVFGLPGHPRAVSVCFETFVRPALRLLTGVSGGERIAGMKGKVRARLSMGVHSASGRQDNISVSLEEANGELRAVPLLGKSGLILTMVRADGTVNVPPGKTGFEKGDVVEVTLL